jgi:hypothetical protein
MFSKEAQRAWDHIGMIATNREQVRLETAHQRPKYVEEQICDDRVIRRACLINDFYPKVCTVTGDKRVSSVLLNLHIRTFSYNCYRKDVVSLATAIEKHLTAIVEPTHP